MVLTIAALSYIGMGMQPPAPELGAMLSDGKEFMRYAPSLVIFPGLTIAVSALSLNLVGEEIDSKSSACGPARPMRFQRPTTNPLKEDAVITTASSWIPVALAV